MASGDVIQLNVGGKVFHTTRSTLTKYDGYFKAMFESGITPKPDETGCIFIDRSPKHFDTILNFLRDGDVPIPDSEYDKEQILKEAQYYMINGLIHLCGGETSEEWKKANLVDVHLRDWKGANKNCEILFTNSKDELGDFQKYCTRKNALIISYNTLYWGDITRNTIVQDFVKKHSKDWDILFYDFGDQYPHYFIARIEGCLINSSGRERAPKLQVQEYFEKIERKLLKYPPTPS